MAHLFISLLNMSFSAATIALAVMVLRLVLKKSPKWLHCLLWVTVGLRLVIPVFPAANFSFLPSAQVIPETVTTSPHIHTGIAAFNEAANPVLSHTSADQLQRLFSILGALWLAGVCIMVLYGLFSWLRLWLQVRISVKLQSNFYLCDQVDSPFIFGLFCPRIYLPSDIEPQHLESVVAHEQAHLRRRDHWWKPLAFLLLTLHWFNPALWVAYILLCRDIEMACDEKVVSSMDPATKKDYLEALLSCSLHRKRVLACPVAFGEVAVKTRIKEVLHYKKPAFWLVLAAAALCIVCAACFLTNPPPCEHDYRQQLTLAPTCKLEGVTTYTCAHCWDRYTEAIPVLSHHYADPFISLEATCITTGERSATCIDCGQTHVTEELPINDVHDLENTQLKAPTCTDAGEGINTCKRCDYQESCAYELLPHDFKDGVTSPGNCVHPQKTQQICRSCGLYEWAVTGPTTGKHTWTLDFHGSGSYCMWCGIKNPNDDSEGVKPPFFVWSSNDP